MIQTCNGQSWCKLVQDTKALMVQDTKSLMVQDTKALMVLDTKALMVQDTKALMVQDTKALMVQDTKALMVQDTKAASLCGITSMLMWKDKERKKERKRKGGAQLVVLMNIETVCWCFPPSHHYGYIRAIDRQRLIDNSRCHAECWRNRKRLQNICHRLS